MKRYNLTVPRTYTDRDGNEKTAWDNVGVMFRRDKGGYRLHLTMFPSLTILAFDADEERSRPAPPKYEYDALPRPADDTIPF